MVNKNFARKSRFTICTNQSHVPQNSRENETWVWSFWTFWPVNRGKTGLPFQTFPTAGNFPLERPEKSSMREQTPSLSGIISPTGKRALFCPPGKEKSWLKTSAPAGWEESCSSDKFITFQPEFQDGTALSVNINKLAGLYFQWENWDQ